MYETWREFANHNEWTFRTGPLGHPCIYGEYRSHQFKFDFGHLDTRLFRSKRRVRLTFFVRESAIDFKLRGGWMVSFERLINFGGLRTGERSFDQQFVLTGKPEKLVLKLFANDKIRWDLRDARMKIGGISVQLRGQALICEPQFLSFIGADFKNASKAIMNVLDAISEIADAVNKPKEMKDGD